MDISSLLSTSIPAYFVIGPLVLMVITFVVLAARKASPVTPQAPVIPTQTQTPPVMSTPVAQDSITSMPSPSPSPTPVASVPVQLVPEQVSPILVPEIKEMSSIPVEPPTPQVVPILVVEAPIVVPIPITVAPSAPSIEPVVVTTPVAPTPTPVSVPTGVIPPISSWKPAEPAVMTVEVTQSQSEVSATVVTQ